VTICSRILALYSTKQHVQNESSTYRFK